MVGATRNFGCADFCLIGVNASGNGILIDGATDGRNYAIPDQRGLSNVGLAHSHFDGGRYPLGDRDADQWGVGHCLNVQVDCDDRNSAAYYDSLDSEHAFPTYCGGHDFNCDQKSIGLTGTDRIHLSAPPGRLNLNATFMYTHCPGMVNTAAVSTDDIIRWGPGLKTPASPSRFQ